MAGRLNMAVFLVMVVAGALQLQSSVAHTTAHVVGDASGWTIPVQSVSNDYTTWASGRTFEIGDVLVFNFSAGVHDVAEVTQADFDACNATTPISLTATAPTNITLNSTGGHYFICTFASHCNLGQRLAINVSASAACPPLIPQIPCAKKDKDTLIIVGSVLLGSSVFINFELVGAACLGFFNMYQKKIIKHHPSNNGVETNLRCFTYNELAKATDGFKEELGRGSFGVVYKGEIQMGCRNIVAVKKLDRVLQDGEREFKAEVNVIAQTHHKNLVRLLGFCDEGEHRLLVYEYMSNGTLASFLFGDTKPGWVQRSRIALGIARGLSYLHEECSTQIIHCDIKPQNILIDEYHNGRISDFGLAKLLIMNQSRTDTAIRGTKGYVAPEWFRSIPVTVKVDVYSFGVLLLEIISCRRNVENLEIGGGEKAILTDWVWDCFQEGKLDALLFDKDVEALNDWNEVERFVMVGIWCIQEDPSLRPTMRKVCQMLEGVVEVTVPRCPFPSY